MILLPPKEQEVFDGLVAGEQIKVMAHRLGKSPRTVEAQRKTIFDKHGVAGHVELLAKLLKEAKA